MSNVAKLDEQQNQPRRRLPPPLPEDAPPNMVAQWLTVTWRTGGDPVAEIVRYGRHEDSRLVVTLRSGRRVVFDRARDVWDTDLVLRRIVLATDSRAQPFRCSKAEACEVAAVVLRLATLTADADDRLEAQTWCSTLLERPGNTVDVATFHTPAGRWEALVAFHAWRGPSETVVTPAERTLVVRVADTGALLVRASDVAAHVRLTHGARLSFTSLHSRLCEVGWQNLGEVEQRRPASSATLFDRDKLKAHLYEVPEAAQ